MKILLLIGKNLPKLKLIFFICLIHLNAHGKKVYVSDIDSLNSLAYQVELHVVEEHKDWFTFYKIFNRYEKSLVVKNRKSQELIEFKNTQKAFFLNNTVWILNKFSELIIYNLTTHEDVKIENIKGIEKINENFAIQYVKNQTVRVVDDNQWEYFNGKIDEVYRVEGNGSIIAFYEKNSNLLTTFDFLNDRIEYLTYHLKQKPDIFLSDSQNQKMIINFTDTNKLKYTILDNEIEEKEIVTPYNISKQKHLFEWVNDEYLYIPLTSPPFKSSSNCEVTILHTLKPYINYYQNGLGVWSINKEKWIRLPKNEGYTEKVLNYWDKIISYNAYEDRSDTLYNFKHNLQLHLLGKVLEPWPMLGIDFISYSQQHNKSVYFSNGNWYVYDFKTNENHLITYKNNVDFKDNLPYGELQDQPFATPILTRNGNMLVYDTYDIFLIDLKNMKLERLTNGRENNISYRIVEADLKKHTSSKWQLSKPKILNKNDRIVLHGKNQINYNEGLYILNLNTKYITKIKEGEFAIRSIKKNINGYSFIQESFNKPPEIWSLENKKLKLLYKSNQGNLSLLTKVELLLDEDNPDFKATLYYPLNFKSEKKYPMIVRIYENTASYIHQFELPTLYNLSGFNKRNYVYKDYFVLEPKIDYTIGNVGFDALNSIEKAVKLALQNENIDKDNVGLTGVSFGGYETTFIMAHSALFKTAIAGVAVTDLPSFYLSNSERLHTSEFWRFENQQFRMQKSLFKLYKDYLNNSSVYHAARYQNPILLWVGMNDPNVPASQTLYLFHALKRNQKEAVLLRYENESHSILKPENQKDLTIKTMDWFNFYLKNGKMPEWF